MRCTLGCGGGHSPVSHITVMFRGHIWGVTSVGVFWLLLRISIPGSLKVSGIFLKDLCSKIQGSLRSSYFGITLGHIQVT